MHSGVYAPGARLHFIDACACVGACVPVCDDRAACYSTSHSEWWKGKTGAAGRRGDGQLFPPHISVQRRHQSLAEMSVLQAGDRPLNVTPSQVNTESQPASHRQKGGRARGWGMKIKRESTRTVIRRA